MMSDGFKDIEKLDSDLWEAADNLRTNSKLTSSDYFMPILGVEQQATTDETSHQATTGSHAQCTSLR